jgi:hypothetical protein
MKIVDDDRKGVPPQPATWPPKHIGTRIQASGLRYPPAPAVQRTGHWATVGARSDPAAQSTSHENLSFRIVPIILLAPTCTGESLPAAFAFLLIPTRQARPYPIANCGVGKMFVSTASDKSASVLSRTGTVQKLQGGCDDTSTAGSR